MTLDLRTRLQLGKNWLANNPDRQHGWVPYFDASLTGDTPPYFEHSPWDMCDVGWRMVESWHLTRRVTGESAPSPEEAALRQAVFATLHEDGLSYRPLNAWTDGQAWMWDQGRALITLCTLAEGNDERDFVLSRLERLLRGLQRIALRQGDALWYPAENWDGTQWGCKLFGHPPTGLQLEGAVRFWRLTGESWALDFARRVMAGVYSRTPPLLTADGDFAPCGGGHALPYTHLHSRLAILHGMYLYGVATQDLKAVTYATNGFQAAKAISTSYGWVPECLERLQHQQVALNEVCCAMDVIKHALARAAADDGDQKAAWYAQAEAYAVNMVAAQQLTVTSPFHAFVHQGAAPHDTEQRSYQNIVHRSLGGFTGSLFAHEWWRQNEGASPTAMPGAASACPMVVPSGCCSPAGLTSFALLLLQAIETTHDGVCINLLQPGACPALTVTQAGPGDLGLVADLQRPLAQARIRLPPGAQAISARQDHHELPFTVRAGYLVLAQLQPGHLEATWALPERTVVEPWPGGILHSVWRGNRVVKIVTPQSNVRIPLFG